MDIPAAKTKPRDASQVQVINRAVAILRAIKDSGGLNLSQLARQVGLARSTVHRIIATLETEGLVTSESVDGRIRLGFELLALSAGVHKDLRHELHAYLEALSIELDETVDLSIREQDHIIFLDQILRLRRLRAVSAVGLRFPLHCTATGKALLGGLSKAEIEALLPAKLERFTPNTITSRSELIKEIETVRSSGVAFDREEHAPGICAAGVRIIAPLQTPAAISVPVPSVRFYGNEERIARVLLEMQQIINTRYAP